MKKRYLIFLLMFSFSTSFSQTKQEAINWFKNNLLTMLNYPAEFYRDVTLERVDECEIVISYRSKKEKQQLTFATKLISVDDTYGYIGSETEYAGILTRKESGLDPFYIRSFAIEKKSIPTVQQKLKQLAAYCHNDRDTWKTGAEALGWLEEKLKKYSYTRGRYDDYTPVNPKLESINNCAIVFSYTLVESGFDGWGDAEVIGKVTETIPMSISNLSEEEERFFADTEIIKQLNNNTGTVVTKKYTILQLSEAEQNLHERILKAMQFISQQCETGVRTEATVLNRTTPPPVPKEAIVYHENGKIKEKSNGYWQNGKATGDWQFFDEQGRRRSAGRIENGLKTGVWKTYYDTGNLYEVGEYKADRKNGEWKIYRDDNKKLSGIGTWKDDKMIGEWKRYNFDGSYREVGYYDEMGKKTGEWKTYYENGKAREICVYKNGLRHGDGKDFYENGKLMAEGSFMNGKKTGEWKVYNTSGKLEKVDQY